MNFYLDFEAKQYSQKIISIGCIAENGNKFYSLVKPKSKSKLSQFIIQLTGITDEMLLDAPNADSAFNKFFDFIADNGDGNSFNFFCYGDSDKCFLEKTIATMENYVAINLATFIKDELVDLSPHVRKFFGVSSVSLERALNYFRSEPIKQKHIAVEDAEMLKEVIFHCNVSDQPDKCPFENCALIESNKPKKKKKKNKSNIIPAKKQIKAVHNTTGKEYLFNSAKQALSILKFAPTIERSVICGRIGLAANTNRTYFGYTWSRKNIL